MIGLLETPLNVNLISETIIDHDNYVLKNTRAPILTQ